MNEQEVIDKIGKDHMKEFMDFMGGQTIGINDDGSIDYYDCDVDKFIYLMERKK